MDKIKNILASVVLMFTTGAFLSAQDGYPVKGTVVDQYGPVVGATIVELGKSNGTTTGLDGTFELLVTRPDSPVEISCVGYVPQIYPASRVPAEVTLKEDTQYLDEVVVIGYGTAKKDDMTGSVSAIKAEDLNRGAVTNTQDMLKGKVAGVLVTPGDGGPGSSSRIRIRGLSSLNAANDPLIVIDGVPIAQGAGGAMSNPLDLLNPNDIESFSVLKDASASAIYGSRASNGVILITTKKGSGTSPQVSYAGSVSIQHVYKKVPVMSASELTDFYSRIYPSGTPVGDKVKELTGDYQTDWQDLIFRTAFATEHNVSVRGKVGDRMPYRASIGYLGQQGTLQESSYDRGTVDVSLSPNFLDKHLTLDLNAKGVYSYQDYGNSAAVSNAAFFNPTQNPYWVNPDGSIDLQTTNGYWNYSRMFSSDRARCLSFTTT